MEVLFQVVKDCFNLWSAPEQSALPFGHDLFGLFVVWWGEDERAEGTFHLPVQRGTTVASVADRNAGVLIDEHRYGLAVVDIGRGQNKGTERAAVVDAGMELEAVVLTLPGPVRA